MLTEQLDTSIQRPAEAFFLRADHAADDVLLGDELGEYGAE